MGDYNINLLNYANHALTSDFVDLMHSFSFISLINRPTRITNNPATLIDNIFVNKPNLSSFQGILVTDISDHLPIIYIDCKGPSLNNDDFIYRRNLSPRNKQAFRNALATLNWDEIYHETDMQLAFSRFHSMFLNLYNTHIPKRKIKLKYNTRKLWLTQGLQSAIKTKNKMYKLFLKVPSAHNETRYKAYRNKLNHILKKGRKAALYWFTNLLYYMGSPEIWSILLSIITCTEIIDIIVNLKNGAPGYDKISASILKFISEDIVHPLVYLCNLSLEQGVFPKELKLANVLPLYKSDDPLMFNNYRPVSLLCVLSKVFESIMYPRLIGRLENCKILLNNQFGFRKLHSSYMALMVLMNNLISSLEKGENVVGVFLDFSKAFDTVDHLILLTKLEHYGIRGNALAWFRSYLTDHEQFVTYNGAASSIKSVSCGVPQGSILGPLLFLVYINDLCNACNSTLPILFADDTNLFKSSQDLSHIEAMFNEELKNISLWLKVNKLSLNVKKTHFIVFSKRNKCDKYIKLVIDDETIDEVKNTKFLGVIIDNKLTWKDHINYVAGKVSRAIGMIVKTKKYLRKEALLTLYYSFVYPYLTYCNHIWGATYVFNLRKLINLQKRVVRLISNAKYRDSADPLYKSLGILKLVDINKYLIARFMFRYCNNKVPDLFNSYFEYNSDYHNYNTRSAEHFHAPKVKTGLAKTGLKYSGAIIWNAVLNHGICSDTSESIFIKFLKLVVDTLP